MRHIFYPRQFGERFLSLLRQIGNNLRQGITEGNILPIWRMCFILLRQIKISPLWRLGEVLCGTLHLPNSYTSQHAKQGLKLTGVRVPEILRRAPRFSMLGARQAPVKNGYVRVPIYIYICVRATGFLAGHRHFSTSVPGKQRPKNNSYIPALGKYFENTKKKKKKKLKKKIVLYFEIC